MSTHTWTFDEVSRLSAHEARQLKAEIMRQLRSSDPVARRHAASILPAVDQRLNRLGANGTVEQRADRAREFLHPTDHAARQRAKDATRFLRGDREAERRFPTHGET
jgi:hypothetical protein